MIKRKNTASILLITLGLLLLAIYFKVIPLSIGGSVVGSCTQPRFNSADPFFNNGTYQCTIAATGSGKSLDITLSPADMERLFGVKTTDTIKGNIELVDESCKYMVNGQNENKIYMLHGFFREIIWDTSYGWVCRNSPPEYNKYWSKSNYFNYEKSLSDEMPKIAFSRGVMCGKPYGCGYDDSSYVSGCDFIYRQYIGSFYYLDPSVVYDYKVKVNVSYKGIDYVTYLTPQQSSSMTEAYRIEMLGSLMGQQSCPANPDAVVFIQNKFDKNPISLKNKFYAENVLSSYIGIVDINSALNNYNSYVSQVKSFLDSKPNFGQYCTLSGFNSSGNISNMNDAKNSLYGAYLECRPTGSVAIPMFNLYINAEKIEIYVPQGKPEILNISAKNVTAAQKSDIGVSLINRGEADTIEVSLKCKRDISPFSVKDYIKENEIKTLNIPYQGAGLISICNVSAYSVNSPQNRDSKEVKLKIFPFCTRDYPSRNHILVNTEYGCAFICPNYKNGVDTFHQNCREITNYDRCLERNESGGCQLKMRYDGFHCVGEGKYISLDSYMDGVFEGRIQPFIPEIKPHKYFITDIGGTPICRYVNEFGYDDNGNELDDLEFDYTKLPHEASQINLDIYQGSTSPSSTNETPTSQTTPMGGTPAINLPYIIGGGAILIGGLYWFFIKK